MILQIILNTLDPRRAIHVSALTICLANLNRFALMYSHSDVILGSPIVLLKA